MPNRETIISAAVSPGLKLLPENFTSERAVTMLVAIGLQESRFVHRRQIGGPARGFWQFEWAGVRGVLNHPASKPFAEEACEARGVPASVGGVHGRLAEDDALAAAFARLLLWTDPSPLPDDEQAAWDYYVRNWRPGKPRRETWARCWAQATDAS